MKTTNFLSASPFCWASPNLWQHCWALKCSDIGVGRRRVLACGVAGAFLDPMLPGVSSAAVRDNAGEAVRRSAASIPGYGQTDVFYPLSFAGNWKAVREVLPSGLTFQYQIRFLPSIEDNAVVADRGWNQANLEKEIWKTKSGESEEFISPSYQWVETNPNDLRIEFADGKVKDIKVTKRATEKTNETVFSSEFQRVTQDDGRGIPVITARRVMAKWKIINASTIEGLEIV